MNLAYLNGAFLPISEAKVSAMDRGFLFGDGVYEVIPVYGGHVFRLAEHLSRLELSLAGIKLANIYTVSRWQSIIDELIERNKAETQDVSVYLQLTRGVASQRNHLFPPNVEPTVFLFCTEMHAVEPRLIRGGAKVITLEDIRWKHRNLKTISLLANVLLKQQAADQGADEAILIDNGHVTECSVSNLFMVKDSQIVTPPKGGDLLPGVTRDLILELAQQHGLVFAERKIHKDELCVAQELWLSSSTKEIVAVTELDGLPVGDGLPGMRWKEMLAYFQQYKELLRNGQAK